MADLPDGDEPLIKTTKNDIVRYALDYRRTLSEAYSSGGDHHRLLFKEYMKGVPDLQGEVLENLDLSLGHYFDSSFSGAELRNVNLSGAQLQVTYWQETKVDACCKFDYAVMAMSAFEEPFPLLEASLKGTIFFMCPYINNTPGLKQRLKAKGAVVDAESLIGALADNPDFAKSPLLARHAINVAVNILSGVDPDFPVSHRQKDQMRKAVQTLMAQYPLLANVVDKRAAGLGGGLAH